MPISNLRERVRTELLEFAWSQWAQMGLAGDVTRTDRWAMDPEALLLLTIEVARRDPRLFDEVLDWIAANGDLLILQRLRNLERRYSGEPQLMDAALAWAASASPPLRWAISPRKVGSEVGAASDVFSSEVVGFVQEPDPVFAQFGYRRPRAERSKKSEAPNPRAPIAFAFRLRLLFGLGSRAEVLRILLTSKETHLDAAQIADEAAFAKRNVNEALSALAESGAVTARWSRNERVFTVHRGKWAQLLDIGPRAEHLPGSIPWAALLCALTGIYVWLEREIDPGWSDYLAASEARSLVDRLARDFEAAGVPLPEPGAFTGADYWQAFEQVVDNALHLLEPQSHRTASS
jgi:hypothetical protein